MTKMVKLVFVAVLVLLLALPAAQADIADTTLDVVMLEVDEALLLDASAATVSYLPAGAQEPAFTVEVNMALSREIGYDLPQQSVTLTVTGDPIDYPIFSQRDYTVFSALELTSGGGDATFTRLADWLQTGMIQQNEEIELATLASKPVVVYVNGQYWGQYMLREVISGETLCRQAGLGVEDADAVSIVYASGWTQQGNRDEYQQLLAELSTAEHVDAAWLAERLDVDSYLDWLAVKMYLGDSDPSGVVYYQLPDGKWRCADSRFSWGLFHSAYVASDAYLSEDGMTVLHLDNSIFLSLLAVEEYRELFLTKVGTLYQTWTTEAMQSALDECVAVMAPEMPTHFARWAPENDTEVNSELSQDPDEALAYWQRRITRMRDGTMVKRPYYIYQDIQTAFGLSEAEMVQYFGSEVPTAPAE